jgi:hypothetical protein
MERYNVVTNIKLMNEIKKSRYFKKNLGIVNTVEKNGTRSLNEKDKFAYFYNTNYKTTIFAQGNIGDIRFYVDYYIQNDVMAFYYNNEEFLFEFDRTMVNEKGIDFFIGHIIKNIETKYENRLKEAELKKSEPKKEANPDMIFKNPGSVTYEDIKAYLQKQNTMRYNTQKNKNDKDEIAKSHNA